MVIESIDPTSGETLDRHRAHTTPEVVAVLARSRAGFQGWRATSFDQRARVLTAAAAILRHGAHAYARLMATEMGKVLEEGEAEAKKCAWVCEYYAQHGASFLAPEPVQTEARSSAVVFRPLGPLLAVMPWNFPFWQLFRAAAPALMAGNSVLLKHAPNVTGCAFAIERLFDRAGLPEGVFQTLLVDEQTVAELIANPTVAGVTFTGSVETGRTLGALAGRYLKPSVLELGGSDAYVVLADADLDLAVERCVTSRLINAGQSCIAAKRFIVAEQVRRRFERGVVERMGAVEMGDPLKPGVDIGPLARVDLRDALHDQVRRSIDAGARCLLGGHRPTGPGAFYPPTVLTDVPADAAAYREELFGPVAAIIPVTDEEAAIRVANDTGFGLGAAVFTADPEHGAALARNRLEAGSCFVNDFVRSDPRLPFGGIKNSGHGRELGRFGIREFVNAKTVQVA